ASAKPTKNLLPASGSGTKVPAWAACTKVRSAAATPRRARMVDGISRHDSAAVPDLGQGQQVEAPRRHGALRLPLALGRISSRRAGAAQAALCIAQRQVSR